MNSSPPWLWLLLVGSFFLLVRDPLLKGTAHWVDWGAIYRGWTWILEVWTRLPKLAVVRSFPPNFIAIAKS